MAETTKPPATTDDWPAQAADRVVEVVGRVRSKTTRPVLVVSRGLVYGMALAILGVLALVLLIVAGFRISVELSEDLTSQRYWAYLVYGAVLTLVGVLLLNKAGKGAAEEGFVDEDG